MGLRGAATGKLHLEKVSLPAGALLGGGKLDVFTELVRGDVFYWGPLMAGALLGSIPVALVYSFFVEYYVTALTGAVKGLRAGPLGSPRATGGAHPSKSLNLASAIGSARY